MPINHTPPKSSIRSEIEKPETTSSPRIFPLSGSSPDISTMGRDSNITCRTKRKREDCECSSRLDEICALLSASTAQTDFKFAALQKSLSEINSQYSDIRQSLELLSNDYDDMKLKLTEMESERAADRRYIQELEERMDRMERQFYTTKIEIRNVPQKHEESKEDLRDIVCETATVLGHNIDKNEIKDVYRLKNKKDNSSSITVDFVSAVTKDAIIKKVRHFNKANKNNKLNTTHLKIDGPTKPIYLSEKLSTKDQRIFYLARRFADSHDYKFCWTSYGKVLMRKTDGAQHIIIKNEADLENLRRKE